jgi:DNA polymerase-3 subunit chi
MQTQVMFYLLPETAAAHTTENTAIDSPENDNAHLLQACLQAANFYRQNQRVYIHTDDQQSAHAIDELLWAFEPDSFVPHNLVGEGPKQGAAVEIGFQQPNTRRPILINLASQVPHFSGQYSHIIDFVPAAEQLKQQARERFKHYRQLGFALTTQAIEEQLSTKQL